MKLLPATLFGRVTLIVCGGLALAHACTLLIILRERGDLGLTMMTAYLGRDVAASVAILDRVPPNERASWLPRLARQNYRYELTPPPQAQLSASPLVAPLTGSVVKTLGAARVGAMTETRTPTRATLHLPLQLSDGTPLTLELTPPSPMVSRTSVLLLALQLSALGAAAWFAVRLAVRPLGRLAQAANDLAPGSRGLPLPATGPLEVVQAAHAFNAMQDRIDQHLTERMQLLAAISHDLQTPITRMRLRAESIPDPILRDKQLADLGGMQALVEEGLAYARTAHAAQEAPQAIDLNALLDGLVCDAQDAGHQVELLGELSRPIVTRTQALRRVVTNLLDNALKFGDQAQVLIEAREHELDVVVLDNGPGIPADQLQAVFDPFYRLEGSRSRDTGGTGLGLAIAQQLTQAMGGRLVLSNRPHRGLEARLTLPKC
jgi:signal transduction histidine kinase